MKKTRREIERRAVIYLPGDEYDYLQKIGYGPMLKGSANITSNAVRRMIEYMRSVPDNEGGDPMTD